MEENILKKANQKRMLGDMAIEGGNFTTAYFKQVLRFHSLCERERSSLPVGVTPAYYKENALASSVMLLILLRAMSLIAVDLGPAFHWL